MLELIQLNLQRVQLMGVRQEHIPTLRGIPELSGDGLAKVLMAEVIRLVLQAELLL